jgi:hypothetical protein
VTSPIPILDEGLGNTGYLVDLGDGRAQYRSLRRLSALDDDVAVWPTHVPHVVARSSVSKGSRRRAPDRVTAGQGLDRVG